MGNQLTEKYDKSSETKSDGKLQLIKVKTNIKAGDQWEPPGVSRPINRRSTK
jgi:hypothetical protein